jgi:hypothetical protein
MTAVSESTTIRIAGGLDFTAKGGKRQGREVPQSLRVKPGAKHLAWKTQSSMQIHKNRSTALFHTCLKRSLRIKPVNTITVSDKALTSVAKILSTKEKPC